MNSAVSSGRPLRRRSQSSGELTFYIGRVFYNYIGLLDRMLRQDGLRSHLAPGMGNVLFTLFERDNCRIKDIAARAQLAPSRLTAMLVRMEHAGLITRQQDGADGRATRVHLTALGRSLEPRCRLLLEKLNRRLQGGMRDSDARTLVRLLAAVNENLRKGECEI